MKNKKWDRIYISSLFTFYWNTTIKTIKYYLNSVSSPNDIFVGGVMATLLGDEIRKDLNVTVIQGLLDRPEILDADDRCNIDSLIPDYKILDEVDYTYGLKDSYIGYATRGCPNRCRFCAVYSLEPRFVHHACLKKQIKGIEEVYGPKKDLTLLDNNVLASDDFEKIIDDIIKLGFQKGSKFQNKLRRLDFNQGLDARHLTFEKMELLSKTAIRPIRIAFDFIKMKSLYISRIKMANDFGMPHLSNYVLYNYEDTPEDFYERLRINVLLNKELGTKIYSFPMKYIPLNAKDRSYVGVHWNKRLLRGVQCIILVTRGMISPKQEFFEAAFGKTPQDFIKIAMMPDDYIIYREEHKNNGAHDWRVLFEKLSTNQYNSLAQILTEQKLDESIRKQAPHSNLRKLLMHYAEANKLSKKRRLQSKNRKEKKI
ncbi:hypothetical protein QUF75_20660 [Desulfococcaceae bacterium HSG7]|nr:hypothetical protein [Desulfococcaceae bacterium HSG7]